MHLAQHADALGLHRRGYRVGLVEEDHLLVRDVGMYRDLVAREIVVDEEPWRLSTASSSISAAPAPMVIEPVTWLRAAGRLRTGPARLPGA